MKTKRFPTFGHFMLILLFFIIFSIPFSFIQTFTPESSQALLMLFGYAIPLILTIWATRKAFDKRGVFNYKPGPFWELLPLIVLISYAFLIVGEFTVFLLPEPTGIFKKIFDLLNETMTSIFEHKILGFLMIGVAAPVLEETLFRGVILKALLKKYKPWKAILYSAIAFGIFHLNPWQFLYATTLGIWLGYVYWKTRSLFYPILIHALLNSTAFLVAQNTDLKADEGLSDMMLKNGMTSYYLLVLLALMFIVAAYFIFEKYFENQPQDLVLATQNQHKIAEIKKILPSNVRLRSLKDIRFKGDLKETGDTLEANARQKMRQIAVPYDVDALADDTGLEVEALDGAPGVYSARYAGEQASYQDNVNKLLEEMKGKENRKAKFRTVIAISKGDKEYLIEGEIPGEITTEPRGENGFGYDSVFVPEGYDKTFAELSEEEKNRISHRARALQKMKDLF